MDAVTERISLMRPSAIARTILAAVLSTSLAAPVTAANKGTYVFRYNSGFVQANAGTPGIPENPNQYDVTAHFFGVKDKPFEADIPTKPGAHVVSWRIEKGTLPRGLSLNEATGKISGTPTETTEGRSLSVRGYAPSGDMGTYAQVKIDLVQVGAYARQQEAYGHTGKPFHVDLDKPNGVTVYSWTAQTPLPDWMSLINGMLAGTPPEAGVWPMAFSGLDYSGHEVAFAYGQIVVEDNPQVAFIADKTQHHDFEFSVQGSVKRKLGLLRWEVEGARPKSLSFDKETGSLKGYIHTFDAALPFRLKATDIDGTYGYSNEFTLSTLPADLALGDVPTQHLVLNKQGGFGFLVTETTGTQSWEILEGTLPDGMAIDPSTGRVSGKPTKTGSWPGVVVHLTDAGGSQQSNPFDVIVVKDRLSASVAPVSARVGVPFTGDVPVATGGEGPYTFALAAGSEMPAGTALDETTGRISGTLEETGVQAAMLTAVDSTGYVGTPFPANLTGYETLTVNMDRPEYVGERLTAMTVAPSVPEYSAMPPATWSLSPSTPPSGMAFDSRSGAISGKPTSVGTFGPYVLTIQDASSDSASTAPFTVRIDEIPDIEIQTSDLNVERLVSADVTAGTALHAVGEKTWTLDGSSAELPAGLRLDPDGRFRGRISATAPTPGVILNVTDSEGRTAISSPFSIVPVQPSPMEMANAELSWPAGFAFTSRFSPTNPAGSWSASASGLPSWMSIDPATGAITGAAPSPGTYGPYSVTASDELSRSATATFTLTATGPLALSLQNPVELHRLGSVQGIGPTVSNAAGKVSWAISGNLPKGLAFDASSGTVSGVAAAEGTATATFSASDMAGQTASLTVTFDVGPRLPLSVAYSVPTLYAGTSRGLPLLPTQPTNAAQPATFTATGPIPPGLAFDKSTGAFAGVPSQPGVFGGVAVSASDSEGETAASGPLSFRVEPEQAIRVESPVERSMRLDEYGQTAPISVQNAVPPLTFSTMTGTALADPDGLALLPSSGALSGVPHTAGTRSHSLKVTDSMGRATPFTLRLSAVGALSVAMHDVAANRYSPVSAAAIPTNVVGSVSYSLNPQSLPSGVFFNPSNGKLSGTPDEEGTFGPYTLTATDSTGDSATASFSIVVGPRLALEASLPSSNVTALANKSYTLSPKAKNAVGAVTWARQSGTLPTGLSVESSTGRITGTPTELGVFGGIVLAATDSTGATGLTAPLTITVQLDGQPILLVTKKLTWKQDKAFSTAVPTVENEIGDIFFRSPQAEALGLTVDPATGVISGTVATAGQYVVDLNVTDSTNRVTSEPVTLDLMPHLRLTAKPLYGTVNAVMMTVKAATADYALGAVTYTLQGALPPGVAISEAGYLSGKPTQLGLFENITVTATDSTGDTATSNPFSFEVLDNNQIPTITAMPVVPTLKAGTLMSGVTPTVIYKKTDDVYSLNQPLPEGLSLNPATGTISGTPAPGSQGIYDGYVLSVADALGRGTSTDEFSIKVRHKDSPSISMVPSNIQYRYNVFFTTPAPTVTNGHAFVGTPVYSISGTTTGLTVDPHTGIISGAISGNRTITLSVADDIGSVTSTSISFSAGNLTLSFAAQSMMQGQSVDYAPTVALATDNAQFSWSSQVGGLLPQGLSMNPETGRVTGTMPFGTYLLKATVSDSGTNVSSPGGTTYAKWVGKSNRPLSDSLVFTSVEGAEHGTSVLSEIVPITGIDTDRNLSVGVIGMGTPQFRICYDANCLHEKSTWTTTPQVVSNGEFAQLRVSAPLGNLENVTVAVTVTGTPVTSTGWSVTSGPRNDVVDAANVLPVSAANNNTPIPNWRIMYDGLGSAGLSISTGAGGDNITYDFGRMVSFNSYYVSKSQYGTSGGYAALQIETPDGWKTVNDSAQTGVHSIGKTVTAQRVRLVRSTVSSIYIYELRIGNGLAYNSPQLLVDSNIVLTSAAQSIQIGANYDSNYTSATTDTPSFSVSAGQLPENANLSSTGLLSLPAEDNAGAGPWTFTVRVTDAHGFTGTKIVNVRKADVPTGATAATVYPDHAHGVTTYTWDFYFNQIYWLYDAIHVLNGPSMATTPKGSVITYYFPQPVLVDRVRIASSIDTTVKIDALRGSAPISLKASTSITASNGTGPAGMAEITFPAAIVDSVTLTNLGPEIKLHDFMVGYITYTNPMTGP